MEPLPRPPAASPEPGPDPILSSSNNNPEFEIDLRHPTPDLQSLQGAYVGNIERLEDEAERMSTSGSELGDEIRKLQLEQKLSDSRKSSFRTAPSEHPTTRSRNASTSSYSNSILDVNSTARWGGYSPGGFLASPLGSVHSGSWSVVNRQRSTSRASRLGQMSHSNLKEGELQGLHSFPSPPSMASPPLSSVTRPLSKHDEEQAESPIGYFTSSVPLGLHVVSGESQDQHAATSPGNESTGRPGSAGSGDTYQQARVLFHDFDGAYYDNDHDNDNDDDGRDSQVHRHEEEGFRSHAQEQAIGSSPNMQAKEEIRGDALAQLEGLDGEGPQDDANRHSLLPSLPAPAIEPKSPPRPEEGMVFYPAPVPRMLNLPKRLSHMPNANLQVKRRTQMLSGIPAEARKSAPWLSSDPKAGENSHSPRTSDENRTSARKSQMNLANLPPQLRASVFFDHKPVEVEVLGESATHALDNILDASTHASVSAFTDHPYAGHVGNEVYGKAAVRKSTVALSESPNKERSSWQLLRSASSTDGLNKLQKRSSSRMSVALDAGHHEALERIENANKHEEPEAGNPARHSSEEPEKPQEDEADIDIEPETYQGPPTTLLAELQIRKAQQKTRNKTAATAFPNGMHSTLLQMDAVAQIEKDKRRMQRVNLAWEDQAAKAIENEADDDDDVPLGMLYPGRDGLANKNPKDQHSRRGQHDQPMGLIEKRQLEDNEPLSKRRNRIKGIEDKPVPRRQSVPLSAVHSAEQVRATTPIEPKLEEDEDEQQEETLGQRLRRLRDKANLDRALGDPKERPHSEAFSVEMLSQLGIPEEEPPKPVAPEDETLGQRRRRLQAEALARGSTQSELQPGAMHLSVPQAATTRPPLRTSHSMAELLAAHPSHNAARKVSNDMLVESLPQGSLLQQSEATRARQKQQLFNQNRRVSSMGQNKPLLDVGQKEKDWDTPLGLLGAQSRANAARQSSMIQPMGANHGMGASSPNLLQQRNLSQANLPHVSNMNLPQMSYGQYGHQGVQPGMQMMDPYTQMQQFQLLMQNQQQQMIQMGLLSGASGGMGVPQHNNGQGMGMGMGMGMPYGMQHQMTQEEVDAMDPRQRDMIDRWRQDIA